MGSVLGFPRVNPLDAAVGARLKRWRETRGMAVDVGGMRQYAPPFRIDGAAFAPGCSAPSQGADGVQVLLEAGLDEPAIAALVARGVVAVAPT